MSWKRIYLRYEFWIALVLVIAGLIHLMQRLEVPLDMIAKSYWPGLFILVGVMQSISSRYRDPISSGVLIAVGTLLLLFKSGLFQPQDLPNNLLDTLRSLLRGLLSRTG